MAKDWQAVADAINTRMEELEISQKQLSSLSGVSVASIRNMQKAAPGGRTAVVLSAVSTALRWPAGYLAAVAAGEPAPDEPAAQLRSELDDLRADFAALRDRVTALERERR